MNINVRNDIVLSQNKTIKLLFLWAISSSAALILMTILCGFAFLSRPIKLVPLTGQEFSFSDRSYSPEYLSEMARKVAQLRFTFNPSTVSNQYRSLYQSADITDMKILKDMFSKEIKTIKHKEISSVFYTTESKAYPGKHYAMVVGKLERYSHGIPISSKQKKLKVQFSFNGSLNLKSIEDVSDE